MNQDTFIYHEHEDGISFLKIGHNECYKTLEEFLSEKEFIDLNKDNEGFYRWRPKKPYIYGGKFKVIKGKEVSLVGKETVTKIEIEE